MSLLEVKNLEVAYGGIQAVKGIDFHIDRGELVTLMAAVNYTGSSSMEIGIKVIAENIRTQEQRHVNSCFFTMVAVDENGKPTAVAPLRPFTPEEKRRHAAAELRKTMRREMEQRYAAIRHDA